MKKSLEEILAKLDEAFCQAEEELIENGWYQEKIISRQRCFEDLLSVFGTWNVKADCLPSEWMKENYLK